MEEVASLKKMFGIKEHQLQLLMV